MRTQNEAAGESQDEVLADRFHRLERPAVEALGDSLGLRTRMRRLDRDPLAHEYLQSAGGAMQGVTLRHGSERSARGESGTLRGGKMMRLWQRR